MSCLKKIAAAALAIAVAPSQANDQAGQLNVRWSGFGTIAAVKTDTDQAEFVSTLNPTSGAGKSVNFSNDSKLGLQADIAFSPQLSATVQLLSQRSGYNDNRFRLGAAFLKYQIDDDLAVRAGKMPLAGFTVSDYRNVGYALTWLRPPVEVYQPLPFSDLTGVDMLYRRKLGDGNLTLQPFAGANKSIMFQGENHNGPVVGLNAAYEIGDWQLRGVYFTTKFNFRSAFVDGLFAQIYAAGNTQLSAAAARVDPYRKKPAYFSGIGLAYDDGALLFQSEVIHAATHNIMPYIESAYATAGYRVGDFVPYATYGVTYARTKKNSEGFPPGANFDFFRAVVDQFGMGPRQRTLSAGLRWNFMRNLALKVQADRVRTRAGQANMFINAKPGFAGATVNVYGASLDFVF